MLRSRLLALSSAPPSRRRTPTLLTNVEPEDAPRLILGRGRAPAQGGVPDPDVALTWTYVFVGLTVGIIVNCI